MSLTLTPLTPTTATLTPLTPASATLTPTTSTTVTLSTPATPTNFNPRDYWKTAPWTATPGSVDPDSATLIAEWVNDGNILNPNVTTNAYSVAWCTGDGDYDTLYNVTQDPYPGPIDDNIPIPAGTEPSGDSDAHLAVLDPDRGRIHDFWLAEYNSGTDTWTAGSGVSFTLGASPPYGTGSNAAGFPSLAGAIWPEEIQAGVIEHALFFSALYIHPTSFRYPATKTDGAGDTADLPMGAWLHMPSGVAENPSWDDWVKVVFQCLKDYGMYLQDTGGSLGIAGVNPINGGVTWNEVGMGTGGSVAFPGDFPWDEMEVLVAPSESSQDLALGATATASSQESGSYTPAKAVDGDVTTRWSSNFTDNQWWRVDLGATYSVHNVALKWETAYASQYKIQTSTDDSTWTDAATVNITSSGWETTTFDAVSARYVRVLGVTRATVYGISFYTAEVYAHPAESSALSLSANSGSTISLVPV